MNKNLTEIVFVLDRSGSMYELAQDTIGGFNSFIKKQKKEKGDAHLTTVLFDDEYDVLHNRVDLKSIGLLTNKEYYARGVTALLDAIGRTINMVGNKLNELDEDDKPNKVLFCITTDGYENASHEFDKDRIKEMIEHQSSKYNWQFIFLGANMDAVSVAKAYGIATAASYSATRDGTQSVYSTLSSITSSFRSSGTVGEDWDKNIE